MAKKNFYAVVKGKTPGIYRTWSECEAQVKGCANEYKGFATYDEAVFFMQENGAVSAVQDSAPVLDEPVLDQPVAISTASTIPIVGALHPLLSTLGGGTTAPATGSLEIEKVSGGNSIKKKVQQKSTLIECTAFLREVDGTKESTDPWECKPNTQMIARVSLVGHGNLSFYTSTGTLLIQGRDAEEIRRRFVAWRFDRLRLIEEVLKEEERMQLLMIPSAPPFDDYADRFSYACAHLPTHQR